MVTKTFGDMLYLPENLDEFPSPESLKRKIMISTKPPEVDANKNDDNKDKGKFQKRLSSRIEKIYSRISSDSPIQVNIYNIEK